MDENSVKNAASEAMKAGGDVARRMRDVTLAALSNRRFDREGIREVVRATAAKQEAMSAAP